MPLILDIGCGTAKAAGAIGMDVVPLATADIVGDLGERPYPFADGTFDAIYLNDVIEHLPNTIKTMEEIHRILRPNGRVYIRVINWNSRYAAMDPTHIGYYTEKTFDFFGKRVGRSYYTRARFDVVSTKRVYNGFIKALCPNERLLHFASFYLSNVLDDLHFELRAVKADAPVATETMPGAPHPWFASLRCPVALAKGGTGKMTFVAGKWLVSDESGCKYPVQDGVPCLSRAAGTRWQGTAVADLPSELPFPKLMPVEDKPIETVGVDDGFREIETHEDLAIEILKTFVPMAARIGLALALLPFKMVGRVALRVIHQIRVAASRARRKITGPKATPVAEDRSTKKAA